jgi:hypothetical protein
VEIIEEGRGMKIKELVGHVVCEMMGEGNKKTKKETKNQPTIIIFIVIVVERMFCFTL